MQLSDARYNLKIVKVVQVACKHSKHDCSTCLPTCVGGIFSIAFDFLEKSSCRNSFTLYVMLVLSYRTQTYRSSSLKMSEDESIYSKGCSARNRKASVTSGNAFHASQNDFLPSPRNWEVVSQPENAWYIGKAVHLACPKLPQILFMLKFWKFFPEPNATQMSMSLHFDNKEKEHTNDDDNDVCINCANENGLCSFIDGICNVNDDPWVCFFVVAKRHWIVLTSSSNRLFW